MEIKWKKILSDDSVEEGPSWSKGRQDIICTILTSPIVFLSISNTDGKDADWKQQDTYVFSFSENKSTLLYSEVSCRINQWKRLKCVVPAFPHKLTFAFTFDNTEGEELPIDKERVFFRLYSNGKVAKRFK